MRFGERDPELSQLGVICLSGGLRSAGPNGFTVLAVGFLASNELAKFQCRTLRDFDPVLLILRREAVLLDKNANEVAGHFEPPVVLAGSQALIQGVHRVANMHRLILQPWKLKRYGLSV